MCVRCIFSRKFRWKTERRGGCYKFVLCRSELGRYSSHLASIIPSPREEKAPATQDHPASSSTSDSAASITGDKQPPAGEVRLREREGHTPQGIIARHAVLGQRTNAPGHERERIQKVKAGLHTRGACPLVLVLLPPPRLLLLCFRAIALLTTVFRALSTSEQ